MLLGSFLGGFLTPGCPQPDRPEALFLTSPSTSPFALALKASEMVLVVPNRHQSVYTRLCDRSKRCGVGVGVGGGGGFVVLEGAEVRCGCIISY